MTKLKSPTNPILLKYNSSQSLPSWRFHADPAKTGVVVFRPFHVCLCFLPATPIQKRTPRPYGSQRKVVFQPPFFKGAMFVWRSRRCPISVQQNVGRFDVAVKGFGLGVVHM